MSAISFHSEKNAKKRQRFDMEILSSLMSATDIGQFRSGKELQKLNDIISSFQRIRSKIDDVFNKVFRNQFDKDVDKIVEFLLTASTNRKDKWANHAVLSTALVTCSFTDVEKLLSIVNDKVGKKSRILMIPLDSTVNSFVDQVKREKSETSLIVVIEQVEAFSGDFLSRLICLLSSLPNSIRLLACISTNASVLVSLCNSKALDLLRPEPFELVSPVFVCNEILDELGKMTMEGGLYFSGEFLAGLRSQFQFGTFATEELKKAVIFAVVEHFIEKPLWMLKKESSCFDAYVDSYNIVLDMFVEHLSQSPEVNSPSEIRRKIHETIQKDNKDSFEFDFFSMWRHSFNLVDSDELFRRGCEFNDKMQTFEDFDGKTTNLRNIFKSFVDVLEENSRQVICNVDHENCCPSGDLKKPLNLTKKSKMSAMDLKKKLESMIRARREDPIVQARSQVINEMEKLFRHFMVPWKKIKGHEWQLVGNFSSTILSYDSPNDFVEETLLCDKITQMCPVSIAMKAILCGESWKGVRLGECVNEFSLGWEDPKDRTKIDDIKIIGHLQVSNPIESWSQDGLSNYLLLSFFKRDSRIRARNLREVPRGGPLSLKTILLPKYYTYCILT